MDERQLDEHQCADVFAALRWPDGFRCGRCGNRRFSRLRARPRVFECGACGRQNSVTAGTSLHGTKVSLRRWLAATRLVPLGVSARLVASELGVTYETAFQLMHRVRKMLATAFASEPPRESTETQVGWSTVPTRIPWLRKPNHRVLVLAVGLRDEWHYVPSIDARAARLMAFARTSRTFEQRLVAVHRAMDLSRTLRTRHRGVSLRWLGRYLAERRAAECGAGRSEVRLGLLRGPPATWAELPPPLPAGAEVTPERS